MEPERREFTQSYEHAKCHKIVLHKPSIEINMAALYPLASLYKLIYQKYLDAQFFVRGVTEFTEKLEKNEQIKPDDKIHQESKKDEKHEDCRSVNSSTGLSLKDAEFISFGHFLEIKKDFVAFLPKIGESKVEESKKEEENILTEERMKIIEERKKRKVEEKHLQAIKAKKRAEKKKKPEMNNIEGENIEKMEETSHQGLMKEAENKEKAEKIFTLFAKSGFCLFEDQSKKKMKETIIKRLDKIGKEDKLKFYGLSFSFKNLKVFFEYPEFGKYPDFGEVLSVEYLKDICEQIKAEIHPPGAQFYICSDGVLWSLIFGFREIVPALYAAEMLKIINALDPQNNTILFEDVHKASSEKIKLDIQDIVYNQKKVSGGDESFRDFITNELTFLNDEKLYAQHKLNFDPESPVAEMFVKYAKLPSGTEKELYFSEITETVLFLATTLDKKYGGIADEKYSDGVRFSIHNYKEYKQLNTNKNMVTKLPIKMPPWGEGTAQHTITLILGKGLPLIPFQSIS